MATLEATMHNILELGEETASKRLQELKALRKARKITIEEHCEINRQTTNLIERGELIQELGVQKALEFMAAENATKLDLAICYAVARHSGQYRKGTQRPYISHPLEVLSILVSMDVHVNVLIAGVLHDTVEDTDATIEEISSLFGEEVAELVAHHSEDKSKTWAERKIHAVNSLSEADRNLKMLVMADKISNIRSLAADYILHGDKVWDRFNAPKEKQAWYYTEIAKALEDMRYDQATKPAYLELEAYVNVMFEKIEKVHPNNPVKKDLPANYIEMLVDGIVGKKSENPTEKELEIRRQLAGRAWEMLMFMDD